MKWIRLAFLAFFWPSIAVAQTCAPTAILNGAGTSVNTKTALDGSSNCFGFLGLVDSTGATAFPAVAALADATANPTDLLFGSLNFGFNGTTWDRLRTVGTGILKTDLSTVAGTAPVTGGVAGLQAIAGPVASGGSNADNPLKVGGVFNTTQPTVTNGQVVDSQYTARGAAIVSTGVDPFAVSGVVASGGSNSGNPLKIGGVFNTTQPTVTNGQVVDGQFTARGAAIVSPGIDGFPITGSVSIVQTDVTSNGVEIAPSAAAAAGIAPVVSSALESSHVIKASAGNLYSTIITTGGTAGCLMIFNATSAPADGAVTPAVAPINVGANTTTGVTFANGSPPLYLSTGIVEVFSSTCGFTKTASATAIFSAMAK